MKNISNRQIDIGCICSFKFVTKKLLLFYYHIFYQFLIFVPNYEK